MNTVDHLRSFAGILLSAACAMGAAQAEDAKATLESQGLEVGDVRTFEDFEVAVGRVKGATPPEERVVVMRQGKVQWQSSPKDAEAGSRWAIQSVGRDLDGDKQPDLHLASHSGANARCCTTHHVYRLKPQVRRVAGYSAGRIAGGDFLDIPGRKAPVMISADDVFANAFAPDASSYFPVVVLEIRGSRFQFANELMQSKLPGQPPPVCAQPAATSNAWLKERCAEYTTMRRNARTSSIKSQLATIKAQRSADKLKWEDYYATGVLGAMSAEMNRYAYTGHGAAAHTWLETLWPGNDAVKVRFVSTLRETQAKSPFAADLKALAADYK